MNDSTIQQEVIEWATVIIIRANRRGDLCTQAQIDKLKALANQLQADKPTVPNVPTPAEAEASPKPINPLAAAVEARKLADKIRAAKAGSTAKPAIPDAEPEEADKRQAFFKSMVAELNEHTDYLTVTCIPATLKNGREVYSVAWQWGEGKHQRQFCYLFDKPAECLGAWLLTGPEIASCVYLNKSGYVAIRPADFAAFCTPDRDQTFSDDE